MLEQRPATNLSTNPAPEIQAPLSVAQGIPSPVFKPEAIVGLSQLRVDSQRTKAEQQSLIGAERNQDGSLKLGEVINVHAKAFSINIYPDPERPEIKPQAIAAMLYKHVENGPITAEALAQLTQKFVSWRLDRFLNLKELGLDEGDPHCYEKTELSPAELKKLASNICLTPWHLINSPSESFVTRYGSDEIKSIKDSTSCVGVHTHPFFTSYSELNQAIAASRAEWSMDAVFDFFESSTGQQVLGQLVKAKVDLLNRLIAAEETKDLPYASGFETLDTHSQKILSELRKLAAETMPHRAEYQEALAEQIVNTRQALSALADVYKNPSPSAAQIKKLCSYGSPTLSGSLMPSPEDLFLARDQGRGKLTPTDGDYFEVIINPLGLTVFGGNAEEIRVWQYDLTGDPEQTLPAVLKLKA